MPTIQAFTDWVNGTPQTTLRGPNDIVNDAALNTYVLSRFLRGGGDFSKSVQGGSSIVDYIMFDDAGTAAGYTPGDAITYNNNQTSRKVEQAWRFVRDYITYTEAEIMLNTSSSPGGMSGRWLNVRKQKERAMWTSLVNKLESLLWASPHGQTLQMETATGGSIMSIPALVNEETNGLANGWTTKLGQNPATEAKWRPVLATYDVADPDDSDGDNDGLFDAFDSATTDIRYTAPGTANEYFTKDNLFAQAIFTNKVGRNLYRKLVRAANDALYFTPQRNDPAYPAVNWDGIAVEYITTLDTAALYSDGAGGYTTAAAASVDGPRFYLLNGAWMKFVYHATKLFTTGKAMVLPNQPDTSAQITDLWGNLFCSSLRRQALVYPNA